MILNEPLTLIRTIEAMLKKWSARKRTLPPSLGELMELVRDMRL
jgi:hypothetical protein